ncbi:MAG: cob(I)yrinic acid a,c-diamide adenosyltransferase [Bacteroidales bacterium]|nr:cob(I)yrinic acid a,c-diamide adenosyltransferase [Bacteroidales bacterium]
MKVYTKTGDEGMTSLIGGKRVKKHHARIEAYGTVDELIAAIGLVRDGQSDDNITDQLIQIQDNLMVLGAILAADESFDLKKIPALKAHNIVWLEQRIDEFEEELPPLKAFVLPGGHTTVSYCHLARTICRRSERRSIELSEISPVQPIVIQYLNRLSDYLFVLSRKLTVDLKVIEILWEPNLED